MHTPKISVIISTYSTERFAYICECLDSLRKQTLKPSEILLVLDPDPLLINFYASNCKSDIRILVSEHHGLSSARNEGIKMASGDLLAFIDDDAVAKRDWLELLAKNCEESSVLGVGGFVQPVWEAGRPIWFPEEIDWAVGCSYAGLGKNRCRIRNPIGCNMLFRKEVFQRIGLFNNNIGRVGKHLMGSEEAELSIRALNAFPASKILYEPNAIVYHWVPQKRANYTHFFKRSYYEGVSKKMMAEFLKENKSIGLVSEKSYLNYLIKVSFIQRVKKLTTKNTLQLIMLTCSTIVVIIGYTSTGIKRSLRNFSNNK